MTRVPDTETAERRKARIEKSQRAFLDSFDSQIKALDARDADNQDGRSSPSGVVAPPAKP